MPHQLHEIRKCELCGNIVEFVHPGGGEMICCGKPMKHMAEGTVDASKEKHIPQVTKVADGYDVVIGSVVHPMEEKHYIEWIELIADGISYKHFLKAGQEPRASFKTNAKSVTVREYCNLHGLWKSSL